MGLRGVSNNDKAKKKYETPHTTKSVAYWLSQFTYEGMLFVRISLLMLFNQSKDGFNSSTRSLIKLAKKCIKHEKLMPDELNLARTKMKNHHLVQLKKLWNDRYKSKRLT